MKTLNLFLAMILLIASLVFCIKGLQTNDVVWFVLCSHSFFGAVAFYFASQAEYWKEQYYHRERV